MKIKRIMVTLFTLVMVFIFSGCTGGAGQPAQNQSGGANKETGNKKLVIGITLSNFSDKYRTYVIDSMKQTQKNYPDIEFIYNDSQNDANKQMTHIENFIAQKVSAIILTPVDTIAAVDMVDRANKANIPIIISNQTFDGVEKATAYVGSQSIESGTIQMTEVAKMLNGKGNIAIMNGQLGHEAQIKRTEGNKAIISKSPDMKVVMEGGSDFDRAKGMTMMENWLQSGKQIDAVVANNDEMAIGAIMAIDAAGKKDILVAGIDATPDALEFVKAGKLKVTVFQDAFGQGKGTIDIAAKAAKGEKVEKNNYVPYQLVTKDNVEEYIKKWK
jgi:inositol transport system substrate-binding protein